MSDQDISYFDMGKRVSIELGTQLQLEVEGVGFRLKGELVGMDPEEYLIIKGLNTNIMNIKSKLFKGNHVVVRYLYKGTIFGFQSYILGVTFDPLRVIFIRYPKIIEEHSLRKQSRIDCFLPAKINLEDNIIEGAISDISKTGCMFIVKASEVTFDINKFDIDKELSLKLLLPGVKEELILPVKQKNLKRDSTRTSFGLEFDKIDAEVQGRFYSFLSDLSFHDRG